jgi:hypothetical protein
MVVPNAENIETATDQLGNLSDFIRTHQIKELHAARSTVSSDFEAGYELGLQTARVFLAGSAILLLNKIKPEDVL